MARAEALGTVFPSNEAKKADTHSGDSVGLSEKMALCGGESESEELLGLEAFLELDSLEVLESKIAF